MTSLSKAPAERSQVLQLLPIFVAILAMMPAAWAGTTDISNQPLATLPDISASPNLMFILDNSGSMSFEHMPDDMDNSSAYGYVSSQCNGTAYDPTVTYKPPKKYDGSSYPDVSFTSAPLDGYSSGGSTLNLGSSTATYPSMNANNYPSGASINNPFYHYYTYNKSKGSQSPMGWVYTASGVDTSTTFYKECYSNIGAAPGSNVFTEVVMTSTSAEKQNYANWFSYYRKRYLLMRTAVGLAINGLGSNYNVGFNAINGSDGRGNASAADGTYFRDVKPFDASAGSSSQKANFYSSLYGIAPSGATPLRGALAKAGQYFANKATNQTYDPMQYACQRNYALLTTDGYWNTDSGGVGPYQLDGATLVGNQDGGELKPMYDGATSTTVTTVTTYTAPVTSTSRTATITWSRTKSSTGSKSGTKYPKTDVVQAFAQTQSQTTTAAGAENGTATKTVTDMVTDGVEVAGYPKTSAVSYSNWTNTGAPVWTTSSDSGAPTESATATTGCGSTGWTDVSSSTVKVKSPIDPAQYSPSCKGSAASPTYTYGSPVVGTFTAGTPVVTMSSTGGSADTLADVADYYYKTDLRNGTLGNCSSGSTGKDVCRDNVPPDESSGDPEKFQHMNTFTIGLGVNGTLAYDSKVTPTSGTLVNWPNPCGSTGSSCSGGDATNVDDLWHAALDGRGHFYSALSAAALSAAINGALTTVTATTGSGSAASTSSLELVSGDNNQVYKASYTTGSWTGDVQAYTLNGDGSTILTPAVWSAQSKLDGVTPASRKLYFNNSGTLTAFTYANLTAASLNSYFDNFCSKSVTPSQCAALNAESTTSDKDLANSGSNLVNYLIGVRSYEAKVTTASSGVSVTNMPLYRARTHLLGDIINGAPVYIGKPPFIYVDAGYADFKTAQASRTPVVYAAANDGMLHAFSASTGQELWAFIPTAVIPNLYKLANASYATNHAYFVDGAPVMGDVYINGHWRTILVGGLNDGGQSYYALDVTDPSNPPTLLWEFTDPNLGLSYGNPVITKRKDGTWVIAFSSGYNNTSGDGNGHLFVVDAASGTKLLDISTYTTGTTKAGSSSTPSGLGKVNAWVDDPTNNTSLRFYGGDLLGNLWRFDVDNLVLPNQGSQLLASFEAGGVPQPITTRPQTVVVGSTNRPVVVVATGRYLGVDDPANTDQQSVYAVADNLTATGWGDPRSLANAAVFVKQTITASGSTASVTDLPVDFTKDTIGGWYVDLPHSGERVFTNPTLQFNTLVVATGIPNSDACTTGGSSWLYYFNVKNGGVITSDVPVGSQLASDALAVGINWVKDSSGNVHILVQDSKGNIVSKIPPGGGGGGPLGTFRTSWRELTN
jgi:type IV pilus assembly protein PilY1